MKSWRLRPKEEAHLLNPAFCCVNLTAATSGYLEIIDEGLPFPLVFMFLPIVLHKATREKLPKNTRTSMATWLLKNPDARIQYYSRLISLKPFTQEAIRFGLNFNWIFIKRDGLLGTRKTNSDINNSISKLKDEARDCVKCARLLGRWFAKAGNPETVMAFWGIRP